MTEQEHQIEELKESQQRLAMAMNAGNLCYWEIDLVSMKILYSDNASEILGFPVPDTLEEINALVHPDDQAATEATGHDAILNRKKYFCKYRLVNPQTGISRWYQSQGVVKTSSLTGRLMFVGVTQEITERKNTEAMHGETGTEIQLRTRELPEPRTQSGLTREKYEALFRSIDQGFCILERIHSADTAYIDFRFLDVNPAFGKLTGVINAEGRSMREAFPVESSEWIPYYDNVFRSGQPVKFDSDLLSTGHHLELYAYPVTNLPEVQVAALFIDITDRKMRERNEEFISEVTQHLMRMQDPEEIMQVTGARLGWHGGFSRCLFIDIQPDEETVWVNRYWQQHGVPVLQGYFGRDVFIADKDLATAKSCGVVVAGNSAQAKATLSNILTEYGVKGSLMFPFYRDQKLLSIVCLTDQHNRTWSQQEIDLAGTVAGRLWTAVERCRFEKALKESEMRLQKAISIETVGVTFFNERGKFINANEAFCKLSGYSHEELSSGKIGWDTITPPEWIEKGLEHAAEFKQTGRTTPYEKQYMRRDGTRYWVLVAASRISDTEIVGYAVDINERREAVEALISSETEHRNMAARLNLAMDAGRLGSFDYHLANGAINCSAQCKQNFGLGEREFLNFDKLVSLIFPEDRQKMLLAVQHALENNQEYHAEYRVRKPDGSVTWLRASGKAVYEEGVPVRIVGVTQDIFEEKDFAAALNKQVAERTMELNRSNEDLLQFAHVASHDLKEPVRKMRIFTSMLKEELASAMTPAALAFIGKIQHAGDRMISMIDGVLTYSMHTNAEDVFSPVNLSDIINQIGQDLELTFSGKQATLQYGTLPRIEGTTVLIYQLFYNLILNALKFSKKDVPLQIAVSATYETDEMREWVVVEVADNGIGLENEYAEKIFESFVRLNAKAEYEGTGLGLSLCRKIVARHKGFISARGIPGEGSVFTVRLPARHFNTHGFFDIPRPGETCSSTGADG